MQRRTITFDDDVWKAVQQRRAAAMREGQDLSFTAAVNHMLRMAMDMERLNTALEQAIEKKHMPSPTAIHIAGDVWSDPGKGGG